MGTGLDGYRARRVPGKTGTGLGGTGLGGTGLGGTGLGGYSAKRVRG